MKRISWGFSLHSSAFCLCKAHPITIRHKENVPFERKINGKEKRILSSSRHSFTDSWMRRRIQLMNCVDDLQRAPFSVVSFEHRNCISAFSLISFRRELLLFLLFFPSAIELNWLHCDWDLIFSLRKVSMKINIAAQSAGCAQNAKKGINRKSMNFFNLMENDCDATSSCRQLNHSLEVQKDFSWAFVLQIVHFQRQSIDSFTEPRFTLSLMRCRLVSLQQIDRANAVGEFRVW